MKSLWRSSVVVILLFTIIGCSVQNRSVTDPVNINPNTGGKESGLSEEYHGHIQQRPEEPGPEPNAEQNFQSLAVQQGLKSVQLLGINDLHGQLNVTRTVNGRPVGRADYLAAYLKQRQSQNINTLLVHAGDMVGASAPVSAILNDEPTIEILKQLRFNIGTIGNHEFDQGVPEMLRLIHGGANNRTGSFAGASFPYVAANVIDKKTGNPILPPYTVITVNDVPIGFIGICLSDTPSTIVPSAVEGVKFLDEVTAINRSVAELKKQGVRAIVVLAHNPGTSNINGKNPTGELVHIANKTDGEVDIIYGGHNHAYMNTVVANKLLVQSYSYGTAFSDVDILIDPRTKDIVHKKAEVVTTYQTGINPDPQIRSMIKTYEAKVGSLVNRVIGRTTADITAHQNEAGESALGELIADAQRAATQTDFALMNPGGIRADIGKGTITWGEIYTVQPFGNKLVKIQLTGKQIHDVLNQQWGNRGTKMLQISGMSYTWDANRPIGDKVVNILLSNGSQLDPGKTYSVTVNNFLAEGGDNFTVFRQGIHQETGKVDIDGTVRYIRKLPKPFTYHIQGRIRKLHY